MLFKEWVQQKIAFNHRHGFILNHWFPASFWHQGLVLWKTVFPRTRVGWGGVGWGGGFRMIQVCYIFFLHWSDRRQSSGDNVSNGSGCKYADETTRLPSCSPPASCTAQFLKDHVPEPVCDPGWGSLSVIRYGHPEVCYFSLYGKWCVLNFFS